MDRLQKKLILASYKIIPSLDPTALSYRYVETDSNSKPILISESISIPELILEPVPVRILEPIPKPIPIQEPI